MRYLVMLALAFTLGACSSKGKKADSKDGKAKVTKSNSKSKKKAAAKSSGDTVKCSGFGVSREIAIMRSPDGCSVQYTKDGVMKEVATGAASSNHCQNVASQIQTKLESNGFTCQ